MYGAQNGKKLRKQYYKNNGTIEQQNAILHRNTQ